MVPFDNWRKNQMDYLRLIHDASLGRNHFGDLDLQMRKMQSAIQTSYERWQSTCISVVTYLTVVATVAIYDMMLTIQYWPSLKQMEENPMGRWLMNLDCIEEGVMPNLTLFITMKSIGTLIVLITIFTLVIRSSRLGHPVAFGVSCFQLGLAAYLTFGLNE